MDFYKRAANTFSNNQLPLSQRNNQLPATSRANPGALAKARASASSGLLGSFKKGGKVKKTGPYKLHKGERVLNTKQVKKMGNKKIVKKVAKKVTKKTK